MSPKSIKSAKKTATFVAIALRAAPAVAAPLAGARYQVRYFWLQALPMLTRGDVVKVVMEHHKAEAMDDIAVFYRPPGKNDGGELTDVDFYQAKYHVDQRATIDSKFFTDPKKSGTAKSLLKRMADTWVSQIADYPNCRFTFFTTWHWDHGDPIMAMIAEKGHLRAEFFTAGEFTKVGKVREKWLNTTGLERDIFNRFASRLRFYYGLGTNFIDESLRNHMQTAGLELPPLDTESYRLDDLGNRLLETGRREWDKGGLRALLEQEKMFSSAVGPRHQVVSVRSFTRCSGLGLEEGDVDIDLTDLFDGRRPRSTDAWTTTVPNRLSQRLTEIALLRQPVELALDCHLSIAWHMGMLLDSKSGVTTVLRQKVNGRNELWDTSQDAETASEWNLEEADGDDNLVVVVSLTHPSKDDVLRSLPHLGLTGARIMHFLHTNQSNTVVRDGKHAITLATTLARTVRDALAKKPARHVHLFVSAPVSFAFLLGQCSGVLGPATAYEFDFKGTKTYSPGASSTAV